MGEHTTEARGVGGSIPSLPIIKMVRKRVQDTRKKKQENRTTHVIHVLREFFGSVFLGIGIAGLILPIIPGFLFIFIAFLILGPSFKRRYERWKEKFGIKK